MLSFLGAFLLAALLTPVAGRAALKLGIIDRPDSALKNHRRPTPYLGGLAILFAAMAPVVLKWDSMLDSSETIGLFAGALLVALGGLLDDCLSLKPLSKLGIQAAAAICASSLGLQTAELFEQPLLNQLVTILWIVGVTNAFNLIDIMDGLAAGIAAVASFFIGSLLALVAAPVLAAFPLALSGACVGFLLYNFNPACIFMGDAGSQLLGFVLACASLNWVAAAPHRHHLWIPMLLLGLPLFEMIFISVLRLKAGQSPLRGSKDHFALRMLKLGLSVKATVLLSCLIAIMLGLASMLLFFYPGAAVYVWGIVLVAFLLVSFRLGRIDMRTG